jgi:signal peptidase II
MKKYIALIILVLFIDQFSKIYIKTHFRINEAHQVADWFQIHFVENSGMAWGFEFGGRTGKLLLSIFRIGALFFIGSWLRNAVRNKASFLLKTAIALIFAGALGNILDSMFYGLIFDAPRHQLAHFVPFGTGYESFLHGRVVDMLDFPIWSGTLPEWIPYYGGKYFKFFNAIFNIADFAISVGVGILILFNKRIFPKEA